MTDGTRPRVYRIVLLLAVTVLVAGTPSVPIEQKFPTAFVYLALGLLSTLLLQGPGVPGGRTSWIIALLVDLGAHALVVQRMGGSAGPFLLLFALPILVWGVQQGLVGGLLAATLSVVVGSSLGLASGGAGAGWAETWAFRTAAFLLLGTFAGLLGRRLADERAALQQTRRELEQVQLDALSIVSCLSSGLICLDTEGRVRLTNRSAEELLGRPGGLPSGIPLESIGSDPRLAGFTAKIAGCVEHGAPSRFETRLGVDGRVVPIEGTSSPILDPRGRYRGLVVLFGDVSDRIRQHDEEKKRERLAWIGQLSAGLAHEIRNSLKPITGCVEMLQEEPPGDGQARLMEIILRESENLEAFLTEFLSFARDKSLTVGPERIERVVEEESDALAALADGRIQVVRAAPEDEDAFVAADRSALSQILRNLGMNALEATESGQVELGWRTEGQEVVLYVRDHGPGIPDEIHARICDPFFTTKARGTGLGLAIARDLAERQKGRLSLEPADGGGTVAELRLPLAEEPLEIAEGMR
ncbi:MAG: PAS domain-containing protein [Candidatus Eisenbacteria bacterium]|uniref:histidine kinase n=1 Tax=Eiseniibacteriota bacterium TaxID=2212470 RepID=A0A956NDI4_UNCEI|nr:PAS domain-containing protein [Candidatus Eisenbacteria bacterium]MCB9462885.1 PAS domain-containing protein [Candidatus Eisenbacteria bacterium]